MKTITKEQFDNLKVGDELKNEDYTLLVDAKTNTTILVAYNEYTSCIFSLKRLQDDNYSITKPIQHNCGFPYGDYSDKEVIVKVSDISIDKCNNCNQYTRLISVSKDGFTDHNRDLWMYALLVTNNVELVK